MTVQALSFDEPVRQESLVSYAVRKRKRPTVNEAFPFDFSIESSDELSVDRALCSSVVVEPDVERG